MKISVTQPVDIRSVSDAGAVSEPRYTIHASDLTPSPLGRVTLIASIVDGHGVQPARPMRVYPDYAWVMITRGRGWYRDEQGIELPVHAGDAILVVPSLAHVYGPDPHTSWDEVYVVFNGPAFDAWLQCGVLSPRSPICRLPSGRDWAEAVRGIIDPAKTPSDSGARRGLEVCRLLALLTEAMEVDSRSGVEPASAASHWAARAFALLLDGDRPARPLPAIAGDMNVSVETFRRRFRAETGQSPARWRAERHIETACHWMMHTQLTNAQIAARLGFGDEFHFSRRFSQLRGLPPSEFRRRQRI